jgi:hypothetical protein
MCWRQLDWYQERECCEAAGRPGRIEAPTPQVARTLPQCPCVQTVYAIAHVLQCPNRLTPLVRSGRASVERRQSNDIVASQVKQGLTVVRWQTPSVRRWSVRSSSVGFSPLSSSRPVSPKAPTSYFQQAVCPRAVDFNARCQSQAYSRQWQYIFGEHHHVSIAQLKFLSL